MSIRRIKLRTALSGVLLSIAALFPLAGRAQWMEQSISLQAGWNAIYLKVNPAETECAKVFSDTKITQVSWWNRDRLDDGTGSAVTDFCNWYRNSGEPSTFGRVIGGKRYLVKTSAATTIKIKGTPAIPNGKIYLGELNLVGVDASPYSSSDYTTYYEYFTPFLSSLTSPYFYSVNTSNASVVMSVNTAGDLADHDRRWRGDLHGAVADLARFFGGGDGVDLYGGGAFAPDQERHIVHAQNHHQARGFVSAADRAGDISR